MSLDKKLKFGLPSNRDIFEKAKANKENKNVNKDEKVEFIKALATDKEARRVYGEELIPKVDLNVYANSFVSDFFNIDTIELRDPMFYEMEFETKPNAKISYLSQHGGTPAETVVADGDLVQIVPYFIQSPEVHMNKLSLKQGSIANEEKMRAKLERGMTKRINKDMWTLLRNGLVGTGSSLEQDMQIILDEDYKNFPETNNIDASAEAAVSLEIFKTIADYCNRIGVQVNTIYIPSNRVKDIYDWVTTSATNTSTLPESMYEEIARNGMLSNLFGYPVNLQPVHTLDGTEGNEDGEIELFVSTNAPAGELRNVRNLDNVYMDEDASRLYMTQNKALAMFQPSTHIKNYLRVVFDKFSG